MRVHLLLTVLAGCAQWDSAPVEADAELRFAGNPPARGPCALEASPDAVSLGPVRVGDPAEARITLRNTGTEAVDLSSVRLEGGVGLTATRRESGPVAPGASTEFSVSMRTLDSSQVRGTLHIEYICEYVRGGELEVPIEGRVQASCLKVSPPQLELEAGPGRADYQFANLTGCAARKVWVESISIEGADAGAFRLDSHAPLPLQIGDPSVEGASLFWFSIGFTPMRDGPVDARVRILTDAPLENVVEVPLRGRPLATECLLADARASETMALLTSVVTLDGSNSRRVGRDDRPFDYTWAVVERPEGSTSQPLESVTSNDPTGGVPDNTRTSRAQLYLDAVGRYVVELRVIDTPRGDAELCPSDAAQVVIEAFTAEHFVTTLGSSELAVRVMPEGAADFDAEAYPPGFDRFGAWGQANYVTLDAPDAPIPDGTTLRIGIWNTSDRRVLGQGRVVCNATQVYPPPASTPTTPPRGIAWTKGKACMWLI